MSIYNYLTSCKKIKKIKEWFSRRESNLRQLYLLKFPCFAYCGPNKIFVSKINFFHSWVFTIIGLHAKNSKKIMNGVPNKAIYDNFFGWNSPTLPILGQIKIWKMDFFHASAFLIVSISCKCWMSYSPRWVTTILTH